MTRLFPLALLALSASASAVPLEFTHLGRLADSAGTPIDGEHSVKVSLFDEPSGGTELFTDTFSAVDFEDGLYSLIVGSGAPLDESLFGGDALYLEIAVDGGPALAERLPVLSVPYAVRAASAEVAESLVVSGESVFNSDGTIDYERISGVPDAEPDTLDELALSCGTDQIASFDGSAWVCADAGAHVHSADQITSGKLEIERLPVGTDDASVASGAHSHDLGDTTGNLAWDRIDGDVPFSRLPVGTSGSEVAAGNHSHSFDDLAITGSLSLGDNDVDCDGDTEGMIRYTDGRFEGCTPSGWQTIVGARDGSTQASAAASCKALLDLDVTDDGLYWIDVDEGGPKSPFQTWCDQTTDGGGWTLMGTIFGGDTHRWNTQQGLWSDTNTTGSSSKPFEDFKTPAWYEFDLTGSNTTVMWQRRQNSNVRASVEFSNACLFNKSTFNELFLGDDTSLRCGRGNITVIEASGNGEGTNNDYYEGGVYGLDGGGTNGWCWNGGDNNSNTFRGHAGWNQDDYSTCVAAGHLGYIGVWTNGSSQYSNRDIDTTNWMSGQDVTTAAVSFFVRE